jgi:adenosylcobinamide-GDP ribazoletransferase
MDARRGPFDDFAVATTVLTRLPVGVTAAEPGAVAAAAWAFPLVGAGIGALCAFAYFVAGLCGLDGPLAALLAIGAGLAITGAFHEDGLADTTDGFGGGRTREEKLAIMRDSRQGTFGILALVLSIGLRGAALISLGDPIHAGLALVAAHVVSRAGLPWMMHRMSPARTDGLGATAGRPSLTVALTAIGIGCAIAIATLGPLRGGIALIASGAAVELAAMLARRQIGGYTGDVLGFFQQIGEIAMLLVAAAR